MAHNPVPDVGDGESLVIADILTTRLPSITHEVRLFISPGGFCCCAQDKHPEDEKHSQPDFPHHCGVLVDFFQEFSQEAPVTHFMLQCLTIGCAGRDR
uniref:Uncharacterized protein n=1 Tax=Varanus komodoensis TaxID=61221 RepID=A0A8D2L741_VARKO